MAEQLTTTGTALQRATTGRSGVAAGWRRFARQHVLSALVVTRLIQGVLILWVVSVLIYAATILLPGNVATAILGQTATPQSIHALDVRLHLNESVVPRYFHWLGGVLTGSPGVSLANGQPIWAQLAPWFENSLALVLVSGALGTLIGVALGAAAAIRRDRVFDHVASTFFLVVTALPEFVVAVTLVIVFATLVWPVLPAVSTPEPGHSVWSDPTLLVLPVATLVLVVVPYIYRMTRSATIDALESEFVELARLKGLSSRRVLLRHALTAAAPPIVQVIGVVFLYLAGGIVVVEYVFAFPGVGNALVNAVSSRDVPVVQLIVLILAAFYVLMNILTDVLSVALTPRRRYPR